MKVTCTAALSYAMLQRSHKLNTYVPYLLWSLYMISNNKHRHKTCLAKHGLKFSVSILSCKHAKTNEHFCFRIQLSPFLWYFPNLMSLFVLIVLKFCTLSKDASKILSAQKCLPLSMSFCVMNTERLRSLGEELEPV